MEIPELYFKTDKEWRKWLHKNHQDFKGVYLIFYKVEHENDSMRWEQAVKVALCYGWIDSTVKSFKSLFCQFKKENSFFVLKTFRSSKHYI